MPKLLFYSVLVCLLSSCQEAIDFYIGIPLQPEFEENNFEPGMNVFGIIRPDSVQQYDKSFIHVQQIIAAVGDTTSDLVLQEALVTIYKFDGSGNKEAYPCEYTNFEGVFRDSDYRPSQKLYAQAGDTLELECEEQDLPVLRSQTIVPGIPELVTGSLVRQGDLLQFIIKSDSSAFLYDIYLKNGDQVEAYQRLKPQDHLDTPVALQGNLTNGELSIYAYDHNLATYFLTSNNSLNFNKYRKPYSVVENGYGVFGSLNYLELAY